MKTLMKMVALLFGLGATIQVLYAYTLESEVLLETEHEERIIQLIETKNQMPEDKTVKRELREFLIKYLNITKGSSTAERGDPGV